MNDLDGRKQRRLRGTLNRIPGATGWLALPLPTGPDLRERLESGPIGRVRGIEGVPQGRLMILPN